MRLNGQDDGYAMAALLVALSVMAILLAVAMPTWTQVARREKEEELVWRGNQYARAIGLFQRKYANAFPPDIDTLVREKFLRKKYKDPITNDDFVPLRQGQQINTPGSGTATAAQPGQTPPTAGASGAGAMPTTSGGGAAGSPGQGITAGVGGGTAAQPLGSTASGGFGTNIGGPAALGGIIGVTSKSKDKSIRIYNGRNHYNEWAFVFTQQTMTPGAPGAPGAAPGSMGRPGMMGPGGSPMAPGTTPGTTPPRPPGPSGQQPPSTP